MLLDKEPRTIEERILAIEADIKEIEESIIGIHDILIKMIEKNIIDSSSKMKNKKGYNIFGKKV